MNKIQNGDFSSDFDQWNNGVSGDLAFILDAEQARADSAGNSITEQSYTMTQEFSINDEVSAAAISAWCKWQSFSASGGGTDGYVRFRIVLHKPDLVEVVLLDTTKTAESGEGYLLDSSDIKANLNIYGNYVLGMTVRVASADGPLGGYLVSLGWYDNINIDVAVKKYKTVHEKLGSSGALASEAKVSRSGAVGLVEAYSTETFSPSHNYETASESVGLSESYSKILKRIRGEVGVVGLAETIQAKRTQGNVETTYVLEDLTQWTEISRVETPWIKIKTELA